MSNEIKIAIVGLDTSHTVEFIRRMQAPDCPVENRVSGMKVVSCLRFETPYQDAKGLDERQAQLEQWGVKVTEDFETCVADCDAIMIEINDASFHLEYFKKCVGLGKPIFLDKPLADNIANGQEIRALATRAGGSVLSSSSLRYAKAVTDACDKIPKAQQVSTFGPLGIAPAGSSIVWYGVHAFEMLERAMGRGAQTVTVVKDKGGVVAVVAYDDDRRGTVELTEGAYQFGGTVRGEGKAAAFVVDGAAIYTEQLLEIEAFFRTGQSPTCVLDDAVEILAMLDACQKSFDSGKSEPVQA